LWNSDLFFRAYPDGKQLIKMVAPLLYRTLFNLYEIWIESVFWKKEHFFHADLHTGNIMTLDFPDLLKLAQSNETHAPIFVIDYGSAGILSKKVRCRLLTAILQTSKMVQMDVLIPTQEEEGEEKIVDTLITKEILPFYGKVVVKGLSRALNTDKVLQNHKNNLKVSKKFVRLIYTLCEIQSDQITESNVDQISRYILKYNQPISFASLFLNFIRFGSEIGICTSNQMINFGRGIAYLNDTLELLRKQCNPEDIELAGINNIVLKNLFKNPKQLLNLYNGKQIC
jgi:thiamine kinase-like enzyme